MCDEFTRENLARRIGRSITADDVVTALDETVQARGAPEYIRCDNGPEFVAAAIRDWCRFLGTGAAYIEPGSPWENPFVESFNGKLRDELFAREIFDSVMEARILFDDWGDLYNRYRPHSSLSCQTPAAFAASWSSRKSKVSNTSLCNGLQRPEQGIHDSQDLGGSSPEPVPSTVTAIFTDGPIINQDPS